MSASQRQSELFAGENWLLLYRAFSEVDLNAYDFDTIRQAMTDYVRRTYPEDFNDWINSSEFVALIDLMAYLGQSLAFRTDINSRENFLDTARRRESVLRLSRYLSYQPKRNLPARGLLKITQISTTEDVFDSAGNNLNGQNIIWDDTNNPDWFEQWILILNDALTTSNQYGNPLKTEIIQNTQTQLYRFDNISINSGQYPFTAFVNNKNLNFEIVNIDFNTANGFIERSPDTRAAFNLLYRNDGNGNSSDDTGFFFYFKQGQLQKQDYLIDEPLENRVINIDVNNINDTDVWVQTVNDQGNIVSNGNWSKIGFLPSDDLSRIIINDQNITFNNFDVDIRNIFQVITKQDDKIALRFGDGRFGQIPTGNLRSWFRVSENDFYTIKPSDITDKQITIPYFDSIGNSQRLTLTFSLKYQVANSVVGETNEEIKRRAPQVYSTQGRMVSGEDYNIIPSTYNQAKKIKAINRIYSGQSRYLDLNDPTGNYQNTKIFSDDGAIYKELYNSYDEVSLNSGVTNQEIVTDYIAPVLNNDELLSFLYDEWLKGVTKSSLYNFVYSPSTIKWRKSTNSIYSSSGIFVTLAGTATTIGDNATGKEIYLRKGSLVKFQNAGWVSISNVNGDGNAFYPNGEGYVKLNENVESDDVVLQILPAFKTVFSGIEITNILDAITQKRTFGISFDFRTQQWKVIFTSAIDLTSAYNFDSNGTQSDASWLIKVEYSTLNWKITTRGLRYVFESEKDTRFYYATTSKSIDPVTRKAVTDQIKVLDINLNPQLNNILGTNKVFDLKEQYTYKDGFNEPRRVRISYTDSDLDGQPDNPQIFSEIVANNSFVFHKRAFDINGYDYYALTNEVVAVSNASPIPSLPPLQVFFLYSSTTEQGVFWKSLLTTAGVPDINNSNQAIQVADKSLYQANIGRKDLKFQWNHYANSQTRIDPSVSNIIDVFVLTTDYNQEVINWYNNGANLLSIPTPPSETTLTSDFNSLKELKMFSDELIFRPAKFKFLFGNGSKSELKARFKVVKLEGTTISDGEIKSTIIETVNSFFDIAGWDFGETFYFSELSAFIHRQMINSISSIVIVPLNEDISFGGLYEIRLEADELFFSTLTVDLIDIIPSNTISSLRIR